MYYVHCIVSLKNKLLVLGCFYLNYLSKKPEYFLTTTGSLGMCVTACNLAKGTILLHCQSLSECKPKFSIDCFGFSYRFSDSVCWLKKKVLHITQQTSEMGFRVFL